MDIQTVSTKSTQLGSFLVARGHKVLKTQQVGISTFFFFTDSSALSSDVAALRFGDDKVSARALFDARTYLLSLIHDGGGLCR
ncbi:MAG: hypothetical protein HXX11_23735 [Desulfuromonadales bacterium]|nr:hypothetical protein [Desulfuromonadales bacterium]